MRVLQPQPRTGCPAVLTLCPPHVPSTPLFPHLIPPSSPVQLHLRPGEHIPETKPSPGVTPALLASWHSFCLPRVSPAVSRGPGEA